MKNKVRVAVALGALGLHGCAPQLPVSSKPLVPVVFSTLQNWPSEDFGAMATMMASECRKLDDLPPNARLGGEKTALPSGGLAGDWQPACHALKAAPPMDASSARTFFETWFTPYYVNGQDHVDGFNEVKIEAARDQGGDYQIPIYGKPVDLVRTSHGAGRWISGRWVGTRFQPYYSRAEIDAGALKGRSLEIAWLKSPADLFVLQLQGSGRLKMQDGHVLHIAYAARNGRPYTPLGSYLVSRKFITADQMSVFAIRDWLNKYPAQALDILAQNEDYVFFKVLGDDSFTTGAPGVMGIGLTPWRTVRADPGHLPFGAPIWLEMDMPRASGGTGHYYHLAFVQDANPGMAYGKVSLFTGWGPEADQVAMRLDSAARLFVLLPRPAR